MVSTKENPKSNSIRNQELEAEKSKDESFSYNWSQHRYEQTKCGERSVGGWSIVIWKKSYQPNMVSEIKNIEWNYLK